MHINRYCWKRLYLSVCNVCVHTCVYEVCVCVCVQILAPPLVQCTYIGPTVPIHHFLLCFKCIYFLKPPPPVLQRQDSSVLHAKRRCSQTAAEKAFSHPSGCCFGEDGEGLFNGWQRTDRFSVLIPCTRDIFDEVTWGLLKYRLVNWQDLLTLISTSALKCISWSLMNSISV